MTLPEFYSWHAYFRHKAIEAARPAEPRPLAELGAGELARAIGGA